jgi:hypothetical protein
VKAALPTVAMPFALAEILALAALPAAITASIYLPTHRTGPKRQQDHIRAKNLLREAQRMLDGVSGGGATANVLAPMAAAIERPDFWAHPSDGLAWFCRADSSRFVWVPTELPALAVVSEHCHVKPLLPLLQDDGRFYLLDLTQHGVQLYLGSRFGLQPIDLPGAPASLDAALGHPDAERHSGVRLINAAGQGSSRNFGTVGDERAKERIKEFFQRVNASVCRLLHAERAPLVTAGVDYLLPLYREVNHYPHLASVGIAGHVDPTDLATTHDRAWQLLAPQFGRSTGEAQERYAQQHGSARTSDNLAVVLRAAAQGRIEELFVAQDAACWGSYDVLNDQVRVHAPRWPDDDDLLNLALIMALSTQAQVHVLPQAQMPDKQLLVASFRF